MATKRNYHARDFQRCMGQIIKLRTSLEARATDSVDDIRKPYGMRTTVFNRFRERLRRCEDKYKLMSKEHLTTLEAFMAKNEQ